MTDHSEQAWALVCASGEVHTEHGGVPTGDTQQCAEEAAEFMDELMDERRPDWSGWRCGPHTVVPYGGRWDHPMTDHEGHAPHEASTVAPTNSTADPTTVGRYREKPVVVEAAQWDGTAEGAATIVDWINGNDENLGTWTITAGGAACYFESKAKRINIVSWPGDWIVRAEGGFYLCTPNAFAATYDACDGAE